jgi:primosomal protein N' (replication factor Y)
MSEFTVAQVLVNRPLSGGNGVFTYLVPDELRAKTAPGVRVTVPFGRQKITGFVIDIGEADQTAYPLREIIAVIDPDPPVTPALIKLAAWMAVKYLCGTRAALCAIYGPAGKKGRIPQRCFWPTEAKAGISSTANVFKAPAQQRALMVIMTQPGIALPALLREAVVDRKAVRALIEKGLVFETTGEQRRAFNAEDAVIEKPPVLNREQKAAASAISEALMNEKKQVFLLHGVTAGGKTEVYQNAAKVALQMGRQVIVLVPEIALAHQMVLQFKSRFGSRIAVTHSALSQGVRNDEWRRVRMGEADIILGPRSAVFAPTSNLGLIVVDEEHEPAYKQEHVPRYHARDVALARAAHEGAVVVLGSATPSLESFARHLTGKCVYLQLTERIDGRPAPTVEVVDLREEFRSGTSGVLSNALVDRIAQKLRRKEQVLLFLNRRGFASFTLCHACGDVKRCPNCDIALTFHQPDVLLCHYCHFKTPYRPYCTKCGHPVQSHGAGTQRVEEEARNLFPDARIMRMDAETTMRRGSHAKILDAFMAGDVDVLIGTQMVAKGLDIPGVTLVGVVNADSTLLLPDFRAAERTFQLLCQVAGRAGRGSVPGEVILQSHCPEHYAVQLSARQNFSLFAGRELAFRKRFGYPPYKLLLRIILSSKNEESVSNRARALSVEINNTAGGNVEVLGPAPCPFGKLKGRYRWHIILKGKHGPALRDACRDAVNRLTFRQTDVKVAIDVDPQDLL